MDFVAYDIGGGIDLDNPHLSRDQMRAVMSRSVRLYQDRHAGHLPQRVVVHKTTNFRDDRADAVIDASATYCARSNAFGSRAPRRGVAFNSLHPTRGPVGASPTTGQFVAARCSSCLAGMPCCT